MQLDGEGNGSWYETAVNKIKEICYLKQNQIEMNTDNATHREYATYFAMIPGDSYS